MKLIQKILNKINIRYLRIYRTVTLNQGCMIDYRCEIEKKTNIIIGEKSILYKNITIYKSSTGSLTIGNNSHIAPFGYMLINDNSLKIGDNVAVAPFCAFYCYSNAIPEGHEQLYKDTYISEDIKIGDNVFIGSHCILLPGTMIEDNVVLAANSVAKGKLKSGFLYAGSPAKILKELL